MKDNQNKKSRRNTKQPRKEGVNTAVTVNDKFSHIEPVQAIPLEVVVYGNNFDKALRYFRSKVQKERILSLYKEKQSYEKPSNKRRRKRNEMKRKLMELDSNYNNYNSKKQSDKKKAKPITTSE